MKINKESNIYTIIYIVVLVVLVGTALAYTSMSLKSRQNDNIAEDKMRQILASLHIVPAEGEIIPEFHKIITDQFIVNNLGHQISGDAFAVNVADEVKKPSPQRELPVYVATMPDGAVKYVLPVYGAGLWGPIWGYIAIDADCTTVYGAYFAHQGETPGLGAEIEKPAFSNQFVGKHLYNGDRMLPIQVVKKGQRPNGNADYVDGVSGGTITSKGVGEMLNNCLLPYNGFLTQQQRNN